MSQCVSDKEVVTPTSTVEWFRLLDRSLVGRVGGGGAKGVGFGPMRDWVSRWWKFLGPVEVRSVRSQAFLFVFPTRCEADSVLKRRWTFDGCDLSLEWWSPLALCASS